MDRAVSTDSLAHEEVYYEPPYLPPHPAVPGALFDIYDGAGLSIGVWEQGGLPLVDHEQFLRYGSGGQPSGGSQIFDRDGLVPEGNPPPAIYASAHSTGVCSVIGGFVPPQDPATPSGGVSQAAFAAHRDLAYFAEGVAPLADLEVWDAAGAPVEISEAPDATDSFFVSNHSYTSSLGIALEPQGEWAYSWQAGASENYDRRFGTYNETRSFPLDAAFHANPLHLGVFAAGNFRYKFVPDGGGAPAFPWYGVFDGEEWVGCGAVISCIYGPHTNGFGDGWGHLSFEACTKNSLVVGATTDFNTDGAPNLTDFTSFGPTRDDRLGVTLVAIGGGDANGADTGVPTATVPGGSRELGFGYTPDPTRRYADPVGTSLAAPQVAATAALFGQYYTALHGDAQPLSATLARAALVATADTYDLAVNSDQLRGNLGRGGWGLPNYAPDLRWGWGFPRLDRLTALANENGRPDHLGLHPCLKQFTLDSSTDVAEFEIFIDPRLDPNGFVEQERVRVVLAWNDPPWIHPDWVTMDPALAPYLDGADPDRQLVNDLDIPVTGPDGHVWEPWNVAVLNTASPVIQGGGPNYDMDPHRGDNRVDTMEVIDTFLDPYFAGQEYDAEEFAGSKGIYTVRVAASAGPGGQPEPFQRNPLPGGGFGDELPHEAAVAIYGAAFTDASVSPSENAALQERILPRFRVLALEQTRESSGSREFTLCFASAAGGLYRVEASTDLASWEAAPGVREISANKSLTAVPLSVPTTTSSQFFRVVRLF